MTHTGHGPSTLIGPISASRRGWLVLVFCGLVMGLGGCYEEIGFKGNAGDPDAGDATDDTADAGEDLSDDASDAGADADVDAGDVEDVGLCPDGQHDGGDGTCVPVGECSSGHRDGGDGACVAEGTCADGFHEGGDGACVRSGTCVQGYRDGGDGVCVAADVCSEGYEDDGCGVCVAVDRLSLPFASGDGSPQDPFVICSAEQLMSIGNNAAYLEASFRLAQDIELSGVEVVMIGGVEEGEAFRGVFDGGGHAILNMTLIVDEEGLNIGLFRTTELATIHDLTLENATVVATSSDAVGGLVGFVNTGTRIDNVHISGYVGGRAQVGGMLGQVVCSDDLSLLSSSVNVTGQVNAGGLIGQSFFWFLCFDKTSFIADCRADGDVVAEAGNAGGLIGDTFFGTNLVSCETTGRVSGRGYIGGIVGSASTSSLFDCHAHGAVEHLPDDDPTSCSNGGAGGLAGTVGGTLIDSCTATGDVGPALRACHGGLVGLAGWTAEGGLIINSHASGNVEGTLVVGGLSGMLARSSVTKSSAEGNVSGESYVGGLIGYISGTDVSLEMVSNTWASGSVETSVENGGGLVGANTMSTISTSYAVGPITGAGEPLGGLVGAAIDGGVVENSYWDVETSGIGSGGGSTEGSDGGLGYGTADMKRQGTYVGFAFPSEWVMPIDSYPEIVPAPPLVIESISVATSDIGGGDVLVITASGFEDGVMVSEPCEPGTVNFVSANELSCTIASRRYPDEVGLRLTNPDGRLSNSVAFTYTCQPTYASGSGTDDDPYLIANQTHLSWVHCRLGSAFRMVDDLDLAQPVNHLSLPLNDNQHPLTGTFDGGGHRISNLTLTEANGNRLGLFVAVEDGAVLRDLALEDVNVQTTGASMHVVGPLATGVSDATIENVHVTGTISSRGSIAGLVNSTSRTDIVGSSFSGTIQNAANSNSSTGLVGRASGTIRQCWAEVVINGPTYGGSGLVDKLTSGGVVESSYAVGSIGQTTASRYAAGLVRDTDVDTIIRDAYALVDLRANSRTGGIVTTSRAVQIERCFYAGVLSGNGRHGIVAEHLVQGTVDACYFDVTVAGIGASGAADSTGGIGYDTAAMQSLETYAGFDFEQTWTLSDGDYPHLSWE